MQLVSGLQEIIRLWRSEEPLFIDSAWWDRTCVRTNIEPEDLMAYKSPHIYICIYLFINMWINKYTCIEKEVSWLLKETEDPNNLRSLHLTTQGTDYGPYRWLRTYRSLLCESIHWPCSQANFQAKGAARKFLANWNQLTTNKRINASYASFQKDK